MSHYVYYIDRHVLLQLFCLFNSKSLQKVTKYVPFEITVMMYIIIQMFLFHRFSETSQSIWFDIQLSGSMKKWRDVLDVLWKLTWRRHEFERIKFVYLAKRRTRAYKQIESESFSSVLRNFITHFLMYHPPTAIFILFFSVFRINPEIVIC